MIQQLSASAEARLLNIQYTVSAIGTLGAIGGIIYANKTGGGFWRYVGYFFLGSVVLSVPAKLVALPFENKIIKEGVVAVEENEEALD